MKKLSEILNNIGEWFKWKSRIVWRKYECKKGNHCPMCLKAPLPINCCICDEELNKGDS